MSPRRAPTDQVVTAKHGKTGAAIGSSEDEPLADAFGMLAGTVVGHDDIVSPDPDAWR